MTVYWRTWYICIACQPRDTLHGLQPGIFCSPLFGHLLHLWDKITILCLGWEFLGYCHHLFRCWTCEYLCTHISDRLQGAPLFGAVACCSEVTHRTAALTLSASLSCRVLLGGISAVAVKSVAFGLGRFKSLPGGFSWLLSITEMDSCCRRLLFSSRAVLAYVVVTMQKLLYVLMELEMILLLF